MIKQLSIYDVLGDTKDVSPMETHQKNKRRIIKAYCKRNFEEAAPVIKRYRPNNREMEYYRLDYWVGRRLKSVHIRGGNCKALLSNKRVSKVQNLIDTGTDIEKIVKVVKSFGA